MPDPVAAPVSALFDVSPCALACVPLDELELAANARRQIDPDGIERLARMLMSIGQLVPCIGHRPAHTLAASCSMPASAACSPRDAATSTLATASRRSAA